MKKILVILGVIFICLILVGVTGFSGFYYFGTRLNKESKAYVDEVIPIIFASWNSKELINRASPEFLEITTTDKIELLFGAFSKYMGPLKEYKGSTGKAETNITLLGMVITANYSADVIFEKAPAKVLIQIIRRNGKWRIRGLNIKAEIP